VAKSPYLGKIYKGPGNLVLWVRSKSNGFASEAGELFSSAGILEYWSVGRS
jgi:hypothetical protein